MSKNVAVFVDVANIFYAAKAAGVDIDYVTLLKSATAGRDFVRAYAYTGLDPENDNQRNFHDFLKRSGYKVVSKDIRKYGDGRIKANLDIELVVDLMRLAQHLDIAVVVSGDGDFAPAIRAVQQMGVRVEVISFRGNTSSDLVEVADDFYEISQIARVEKGARSGRRVASEDDLSMTAVPEKETDMGPRRRRTSTGRRDGRDEGMAAREGRSARAAATVVADTGLPGNVIVLPGERLSRAVGGAEDEEPTGEAETGEVVAAEEAEEHDGDGRRRRRRRGGRGRGRGRRAEGEAGEIAEGADLVGVAAAEGAPEDEDEYLDEELPTLPQHSTFGSVWDTQIGLPSQPVSAAQGTDQDVDDEDEPEIPEYLLAERRQQARGGRQAGRGGRQAGRGGRQGYQSAVDRERYGRSGSSMYGGARMPAPRPQGGGGGNRQGGGGQQQRRPQPQPAPQHRQRMDRDIAPAPASASAEPWSEVPAEVQELLRAELARRQGSSPTSAAPPARSSEPAGRPTDTRGSRGTRRAPTPIAEAPAAAAPAASAEIPVEAVEAPAAEAVEAAPRTTRRRTSTRSTAATADQGSVVGTPEAAVGAPPADEGPAPKPTRRRTTKAAAEAPVAAAEAPTVEEGPAPKPARRRTTKAAAAAETAEAPVSSAEEAPTPKPTRRRSTKSSSTETPEG